MLDPLGVQATNLAVLASYIDETGNRIYLPVNVSSATSALSSQTYTFQFTTAWDIHSLENTLSGPDGLSETLPVNQCRSDGIYRFHLLGHIPNNSLTPELFVKFHHRKS